MRNLTFLLSKCSHIVKLKTKMSQSFNFNHKRLNKIHQNFRLLMKHSGFVSFGGRMQCDSMPFFPDMYLVTVISHYDTLRGRPLFTPHSYYSSSSSFLFSTRAQWTACLWVNHLDALYQVTTGNPFSWEVHHINSSWIQSFSCTYMLMSDEH